MAIQLIILALLIILNLVETQLAGEYIAKMTSISKVKTQDITNKFFKSCKDNPLIDLLLYDLAEGIKDSLNDLPISSNSLSSCKTNSINSCCTETTFSIYEEYLKDLVIPNKLQINLLNTNYYKLIIKEHNRNFNAFSLNNTYFESLFYNFTNLNKKITEYSKVILKDSLFHKWNSMCNFICRPNNEIKNFCSIYNNTVHVNEKEYSYISYSCIDGYNKLLNITSNLNEFYDFMSSMNSTLGSVYQEIGSKVSRNLEISDDSNKILTYLNNSLNDGLYVSKGISQMPICDQYDCNNFTKCIPFNCYDDLFLQYYDNSTITYKESLIASNFSIVELKSSPLSNNIYNNYSNDNKIIQIVNSLISSLKQYYIGLSSSLLLFVVLLI